MTNILEITDGTTTVNLLSRDFGFCLNNWNPAIAQPKRGGIFQSSSLSQGRKLIDREFENIEDSFNFDIKGSGQPETIIYITNLIQLLEQATEYWTGFADKVYIKAKADCEDNPRYALIVNYSWPNLSFPYGETFFSKVSTIASMINIDLGLEHRIWSTSIPGESDCAEDSNTQLWRPRVDWVATGSFNNASSSDMIQDSTDDIFSYNNGQFIELSDDNGAIWSVVRTNPAVIQEGRIAVAPNDDLYASSYDGVNCDIIRSTNNGGAWGIVDNNVGAGNAATKEILTLSNGYILHFGTYGIRRSIDDGASFGAISNAPIFIGTGTRAIQLANDWILVNQIDSYLRSKNLGDTWEELTFKEYDSGSLFQLANGDVLYFINSAETWKSIDNGDTFNVISTVDNGPGPLGTQNGFGTIVIAGNTNTLVSTDNGETIVIETQNSSQVLALANNSFLINFDATISNVIGTYLRDLTVGRIATCSNEVYVANKMNIANLTHVKVDNGGVFTDIFPAVAFPVDLLPDPFVTNDALYFGIQSSIIDSGPFCSIICDIGTLIEINTGAAPPQDMLWEYWNGASWANLNILDNTSFLEEGTGANNVSVFASIAGVNSIHFEQPSDWAEVAVDSITALWVRVRINSNTGTGTPVPTQQNRDIYTVAQPFTEIAATEILGDIPTLLRIKTFNQSDRDGRGGSEPNLWSNRIIVGLRSILRGSLFQSYLNCSDKQNPGSVTITDTGANATFTADVTTPTGRNVTYNPAGVEAMATQVTIALSPSISRDFYGKFHAFVRVQRTAGNITDFDVQLQFVSGSGGITFTTASKQVQTTTAFELLDLGQVQLPVGGTFKTTDLGDVTEIRIQASAASGTPNLIMYDLILMPVDEWSIDSVDFANTNDSIVGRNNDLSKLLDVDSITNPLIDIQSLVRLVGSEQIISVYDPVSPGHAILQANAQQRLWFLAAQTDQTGVQTAWISPPEIAHSIQLFKNERYLTMKEVG